MLWPCLRRSSLETGNSDTQPRYVTNKQNVCYGGSRFNPLLVVTDRNEIADFAEHINADTFRKKQGCDPFAGTRSIPTYFKNELSITMASNDVNKMFPVSFHLDGLNPASYSKDKLGRFDYAVTSIPFAFADIAVPLLALTFEAVFIHAPSWYCFQGSRFRSNWLKELALSRRIVCLNVNKTRNSEFGRFAIWLCIFKTRDTMHKYLKNCNRLFEQSLPVFFG